MIGSSLDDDPIARNAEALLARAGGVRRARRLRQPWPSFDRGLWTEMAVLGWFGLLVPENRGGVGADARALASLLYELGAQLAPEPVLGAIVAARALALCNSARAAEVLGKVLNGAMICLPSATDRQTGEVLVCDGESADAFLVVRDSGPASEIHLLRRAETGLRCEAVETVDGGSLCYLFFDAVDWPRSLLMSGPAARRVIGDSKDLLRLGSAAALLGIMQELLRLTVDYLKTRKQFGVAIGTFQALQHRAATMHVRVQSSRALLIEGCLAFGSPKQSLAAAMAKAHLSDAAITVAKEAIQLHGAIGFTDEHDIGLYFRRAMALAAAWGTSGDCRKIVSSLISPDPACGGRPRNLAEDGCYEGT